MIATCRMCSECEVGPGRPSPRGGWGPNERRRLADLCNGTKKGWHGAKTEADAPPPSWCPLRTAPPIAPSEWLADLEAKKAASEAEYAASGMWTVRPDGGTTHSDYARALNAAVPKLLQAARGYIAPSGADDAVLSRAALRNALVEAYGQGWADNDACPAVPEECADRIMRDGLLAAPVDAEPPCLAREVRAVIDELTTEAQEWRADHPEGDEADYASGLLSAVVTLTEATGVEGSADAIESGREEVPR